jgi:FkbM family methyltransferase
MTAFLPRRADGTRALPRPVRAFLRRPGIERVVATVLRSGVVRERGRFLLRELPSRRILGRYRVRESGLPVYIRHATPDVVTLDEVFYTRHYALPLPVTDLLDGIGRPPRVLDLGANIGLFGVFVLGRFPTARITAVEPDPANVETLHRCVEANGRADWQIVEAAASTQEGTVPFVTGMFSLSRLSGDEERASSRVRAIDVLPELAGSDLAKIDIEGGEWAILADERLQEKGPAVLVVEYHPHLCPAADPHDEAQGLLRGAGYEPSVVFRREDGHGMLWGLRSEGAPGAR